jgi:hypothetical protein
LFGFYHRNDVLGGYNTTPKPSAWESILTPLHIRAFFEMIDPKNLMGAGDVTLPKVFQSEESFAEGITIAKVTHWGSKGLEHEDPEDFIHNPEALVDEVPEDVNDPNSKVVNKSFTTLTAEKVETEICPDDGICDYLTAKELLSHCSAIVGLHPDQVGTLGVLL